jgi:hypothetical protein
MMVVMATVMVPAVMLGVVMETVAAHQRIVGRAHFIGFISSTAGTNQRNGSDEQQ